MRREHTHFDGKIHFWVEINIGRQLTHFDKEILFFMELSNDKATYTF